MVDASYHFNRIHPNGFFDFISSDVDIDVLLSQCIDHYYDNSDKFSTKSMGKEYLFETVNGVFSFTGKTMYEQNGVLKFTFGGNSIDWRDLSFGEKRLIVMLFSALFQENRHSVLLIDEPEMSLHIESQRELIRHIRTINPNCQVIVATHSPTIFNDGWRDKVVWMEKITSWTELLLNQPNPCITSSQP